MNKIIAYIILFSIVLSAIISAYKYAYWIGYNDAVNETIANNQVIIDKANKASVKATEDHVKYIIKKEIEYKYIYKDLHKYDNESCITRSQLTKVFNGEVKWMIY